MPDQRDFRFLADRVELDFHRRPNRFRRGIWWAGALLGIAALGWVAVAAQRGEHQYFAAAGVANAHKMIENDCARCHNTWAPVSRLVSLDTSVSSVDNRKCEECHAGPAHHRRQIPAHDSISCAYCHREHRGHVALADVSDRLCVECHGNLPEHIAAENGRTGSRFAGRITTFDRPESDGGHPEFALQKLLQRKEPSAAPDPDSASELVQWFLRNDEPAAGNPDPLAAGETARYQDRSRIRFNHALHLHAEYRDGELVDGLLDETGKLRDYSNKCEACHVTDDDGRYMKPIRYDQHCRQCHWLLFDVDAFPGQTVPHPAPGKPNIVRGFLIELYARRALGNVADSDSNRLADDPAARSYLPFAPRLPLDVAQEVRRKADEVAEGMPAPLHPLIPKTALRRLDGPGGCRYCHELKQTQGGEGSEIVPPNIPERWFPHGEFRHDAHRMVDCRECHRDFSKTPPGPVSESRSTGDVLLPNLAVCRNCHARRPASGEDADSGWLATEPRIQGARTNCVECHRYHHPQNADPVRGTLDLRLDPPHVPSAPKGEP